MNKDCAKVSIEHDEDGGLRVSGYQGGKGRAAPLRALRLLPGDQTPHGHFGLQGDELPC